MKSLLGLLLLVFLFKLSFSQEKTTIFNGHNLDGWKIVLSDESIDASSVFKADNGILKVNGTTNAYLRTIDVFTNYELHVEWRWPEKPTNSGVLLHVNGYDFWPNCIESQLMDQHAGDIVLIGYGVAGTIADSSYINLEKRFTILPKNEEGIEKHAGEWNSYDIICNEDNISITVNGVLQNEGKKLSLTGGSI
ncbi:MAG: DUF1080 domain-containing protein, partial [Prolixibacteraceae bacterium]|nr:DUF1080 domain-containing protein [Prolixibacteraceae bacterium]